MIANVNSTELAKSHLVVNAAADTVFLNDTQVKTIVELDLNNLKIKQIIQLNCVANIFTWLDVAKVS
ncbi:hypothetical protein [Acinetobacter genomosp. 15BJ]|uniref:Uncharacterized protein n=1 Tax=Acinetobacter genomosp. 15BJ TaxID=106651 RepID=A0ABT8UXB7_9GAMM|nr:hypothetical protein [Acinetobacter genomosp. 15BJ]MCH7290349.1 hypothetical protein [Acinetobacter genomosp. 15BJ]MDO3656641.1 hypothetical protein [Acinetobacter genomosp. 15BJ]